MAISDGVPEFVLVSGTSSILASSVGPEVSAALMVRFVLLVPLFPDVNPGQFVELCPGFRHLKQSPSLMHLARSSGVSFSILGQFPPVLFEFEL